MACRNNLSTLQNFELNLLARPAQRDILVDSVAEFTDTHFSILLAMTSRSMPVFQHYGEASLLDEQFLMASYPIISCIGGINFKLKQKRNNEEIAIRIQRQ